MLYGARSNGLRAVDAIILNRAIVMLSRRTLVRLLGATVLFLPIWPEYIAFKLPGLPWISLSRMLLLLTLIYMIGNLIFAGKTVPFNRLIARHRGPALIAMFVYFAWKSCASMLVGDSEVLLYTMFDIIYQYALFLIVLVAVRSWRDIGLIVVVFVMSGFVVALYGVYESLIRENVLLYFASSGADDRILVDKYQRDGVYRARAMFSNPLALASYCSFMLSFAVWVAYYYKGTIRFIAALAVPLIIYALLSTLSRAALGVLAFSILGYVISYLLYYIGKAKKVAVRFYRQLTLMLLVIIGGAMVWVLAQQLITGSSHEEALSNGQRMLQIELGTARIMESPLVGYGAGRAPGLLGPNATAIDNYYLTLALESGLPAVFMLLVSFSLILYQSWSQQKYLPRPLANLSNIIFWALASNMVFMAVLSLKEVLPYVFISCAIVLTLNGLRQQER